MNEQFEPMCLDEMRPEYDRLQNEAREKDKNKYKSVQSGRDQFSSRKLDSLKKERRIEAVEVCSRLSDAKAQASALRNVLRGKTVEWAIQKEIETQKESQGIRDKRRKTSKAKCEVQIGRWKTKVNPIEAETIRCSVARALAQDCRMITERAITKTDIQIEVDAHSPSSCPLVANRCGQQIRIDFGGLKESVSIAEATKIWSKLNRQFRPNG